MNEPIKLRSMPGGAVPSQAVIGMLEDLLTQAKTGTLQFVLVGTVDNNMSVGTGWSGADAQRIPHRAILGSIEQAKLDWYQKVVSKT